MYCLYRIFLSLYYPKLQLSVRASIRPESITKSYLTPVKKVVFFASLSLDVTEAVDRNSYSNGTIQMLK